MTQPVRPLIAVVGPTGAGKSALAIGIAEKLRGEIVNCDSLQIYRHFDIGTAKLPHTERRGIRHHLIDVIEPHESFTAADFAKLANRTIREIAERSALPLIAGGTGFYLRALLDGLSPGPVRDPALRARLKALEAARPGVLHRILRRFDVESAQRIHPNDVPKLIRAIEIRMRSDNAASAQPQREALRGFRTLKLGLFPDRQALHQRLDTRCEWMFQHGLLDEVNALLDSGVPPHVKPFESLGYKEAIAYLNGDITYDEALQRMKRDTRRYAKRQVTWFRREANLIPLRGFGTDPAIASHALALAARFVNAHD